jgi:hypothetical protein
MCPEYHLKRGTKRVHEYWCRAIRNEEKQDGNDEQNINKSAIPMASMKALTGLRFVMRVSQLATK